MKINKTDYNDSINQRIKSSFVRREVITCFSYEMEAILTVSDSVIVAAKNPKIKLPTYEDIENLYQNVCLNCGYSEAPVSNGKTCPTCRMSLESEPQEIFEWWIVTEYLYEKLKKHGEPTLEWGNNFYWGCCTSGQAILLDYVISVICEEMEILDGQRYSWAITEGTQ